MIRLLLTFLITALTSQAAVFENLEYGDTRADVERKLLACPRVKSNVPTTMLGRVGLNGTFEINKPLSDLKFTLYFDWTDSGKLNQVTLRSQPIQSSSYSTSLTSAFHSASELITTIYGNSIMENPVPPRKDINEDSILNSHLWHANGGSIMLGVAKLQGSYHLSIRFTQKKIEPVRTP